MNELALFAGAGGGLLGSVLLGWRTVCAVEIDAYCRDRLMQRQNEGHLEAFPIWDDVRTFDGTARRGKVDVVTGGFPCQPFSVAGQRAGEADDRNLWPDTIRVIREVGPRYALLENVPGLLAHDYFGTILGDLAESGYDARWRVLSAAELGAPHKRDRLWILAHAEHNQPNEREGQERSADCWAVEGGAELRTRRNRAGVPHPAPVQRKAIIGLQPDGTVPGDVAHPQRCGCGQEGCGLCEGEPRGQRRGRPANGGDQEDVVYANPKRLEKREETGPDDASVASSGEGVAWWDHDPAERESESGVGRVADGVPHRVDRLRALGNAQVPAVVRAAWELLRQGV